jgi:hypothetical protein
MASSRARLLDVAKVYLQSRAERVLPPPPTRNPEAEPLLLKRKLQLEENNASRLQRLKVRFNLNSEVARLCGKKPLTRLATLATLSPRERAEIDQR